MSNEVIFSYNPFSNIIIYNNYFPEQKRIVILKIVTIQNAANVKVIKKFAFRQVCQMKTLKVLLIKPNNVVIQQVKKNFTSPYLH